MISCSWIPYFLMPGHAFPRIRNSLQQKVYNAWSSEAQFSSIITMMAGSVTSNETGKTCS